MRSYLEEKKVFMLDEFRHYFSEDFDINFLNFLFESQSINLEMFFTSRILTIFIFLRMPT